MKTFLKGLLFILPCIISVLPLVIIDLPWWADILIILACGIPLLGDAISIGVWIWAFVICVNSEQTALCIVFYVLTGVIFIPFVISVIHDLIKSRRQDY